MIETAVCVFVLGFVGAVLAFFHIAKRVYRDRPTGNGDSLLANLFSEQPSAQLQPVRVRETESR
jgi:hypothetical protein